VAREQRFEEKKILGKSSTVMRSNKVRGTLWMVAAVPMLVGPVVFGNSKAVVGVGLMFLIFGIVTLRKG